MNRAAFIKEVRQKSDYLSADALREVLLSFAKFVPRDLFEDALRLFKKEYKAISEINEEELLSSVQELCENIKSGNYSLSWNFEKDYGDGYWSDSESLYDDDGLGKELEHLFKAAMDCVAGKSYLTAAQAMEQLLYIEVPNEYYEDICVETIFEYDLVNLDFNQVLSNYAYAVLMAFKDNERVEKLFKIKKTTYFNLKLSEIAAVGNDAIPDNQKFSKQWIDYLMQQELRRYESALIDAIKYDGGTEALESFVLEHGATYQKAAIDLIKTYMLEDKLEKAVKIIQDGLAKIKGVNANRTVISDLLAEIGQKTNNSEYFKTGLVEGFCSSVDLEHFLNLYALNDNSVLENAVRYIDEQVRDSRNDYYYIHFLNGDYEFVWKACNKDKSHLGWSNSLKGALLPLFVALLAGNEQLKPCIKEFIKDNYEDKNFELFIQIFEHSIRKLPDEEYNIYFKWCEKETEERVKAIVGGQHRGSYYKASALVVSMGEVLISQGNDSGAVNFIRSYKEKYPRHSAFHGCLRGDLTLSKIGHIL